ncbi:putative dehydrogenase [Diaminobutyricimonas aerilata]|uniref:Putative dehydrogenase n=1 Tax=Diaminobutyricimonas aerilata TaxID=1162967 RepID=A0A2M9CGE8_9MICO|nr:Gfo/Idh/MocA family oxidoreductase [Diaminobutyricimonas aerilata]PJJ70993.1 putative dehydrogenase [Diaminobutyricimonas aerilata]
MSGSGRVGVGVIGAGVISSQYLDNLTQFPDVEVLFIADLDLDRARTQAEKYGVPGSGSVEELLAVDEIEIVVNLTIPAVHVEVGQQILAAGKHVWSEKPFALDRDSGRRLLDDAHARGLRVATAPDTFLGAGLQTGQRVVDSGTIGTPLTGLAIMQGPGPESWHPSPEFLFDIGAGPLFDIGPYYLTLLVQVFGPAARVFAVSSTARTTRVIGSGPKAGTEFPVNVPTHHSAIIQFESGASAQLLLSFESQLRRSGVVEINGAEGTLEFPDPNTFEGASRLWARGEEESKAVEAVGSTFTRGTGVVELARAIRADVPERASGELGFHVLDLMVSIAEAAESGEPVEVTSTTARPQALPEGWDPSAATL